MIDRLLRNINHTLDRVNGGQGVENLFKHTIEEQSWGDDVFRIYLVYHKPEGVGLIHVHFRVWEEETGVTYSRRYWLFGGRKKFSDRCYKGDLTVNVGNGRKDYKFNSKDYPVLKDIFLKAKEYIESSEDEELRTILRVTRNDVDIVDTPDDGLRFEF
jgi:hypothetical protein